MIKRLIQLLFNVRVIQLRSCLWKKMEVSRLLFRRIICKSNSSQLSTKMFFPTTKSKKYFLVAFKSNWMTLFLTKEYSLLRESPDFAILSELKNEVFFIVLVAAAVLSRVDCHVQFQPAFFVVHFSKTLSHKSVLQNLLQIETHKIKNSFLFLIALAVSLKNPLLKK